MGSISGRKALSVIENVEKILAIELICAAQSFDYHKPLKSGKILDAIHAHVRTKISHAENDRVFAVDIEKAIEIIQSKAILQIANSVAQEQGCSLVTEMDVLFETF